MKKTCWTERKDSKELLNNPGQAAGHREGLLQHSWSRIWEVRVNQEPTAGVSSTGAWRGSVQACHAAREQHPGDSSWAGSRGISPAAPQVPSGCNSRETREQQKHQHCTNPVPAPRNYTQNFDLFCQNPGFPPHPSPPAL